LWARGTLVIDIVKEGFARRLQRFQGRL
jgi:hypothetical protein